MNRKQGASGRWWEGWFDALLMILAVWYLLPPLVLGREILIPLPFDQSFSSSLSFNNLLIFWFLLLVRCCLSPAASKGTDTGKWWNALHPVMCAILTACLSLLIYVNAGQPRNWPSGDTIPSKLVPISILEEGNLDLNEFKRGVPFSRRYAFYRVDQKYYSAYPLGTPLTALPVFAMTKCLSPSTFSSWKEAYSIPNGDDLPNIANTMELWSAAIIMAISVAIVFLFCWRVTNNRFRSFGFALAYGIGTSALSTAGIALWQHGPACLSLSVLFLLLLADESQRNNWLVLLAGICGGWACYCRPNMVVVVAVISGWLILKIRLRSLLFLIPVAVILGISAISMRALTGHWGGGYSGSNLVFVRPEVKVFLTLLFSPSRGLFVFSPFLLFPACWGVMAVWRKPLGFVAVLWGAALASVLLMTSWRFWAGGTSFGPRYLCETALLLSLILPFMQDPLFRIRWIKMIFFISVLVACHIHILGARHGDHGWNHKVFIGNDFQTIWQVRDSQLMWTLVGSSEE